MATTTTTDTLINAFSKNAAERWLRETFGAYAPKPRPLPTTGRASLENAQVCALEQLGCVTLTRAADDPTPVELPVFLAQVGHIGLGSQRKAQFLCAAFIAKQWGGGEGAHDVPGALFFFHAPDEGLIRLSLLTPRSQGAADYKRQSFLLDARKPNNTFRKLFDAAHRVAIFGRPGEAVRNGGASSLLARFSVEALTKDFYDALYGWYEWAAFPKTGVRFPDAAGDDAKTREHLIRLITRLMFVWFVRERGLVPELFFDAERLGAELLRDFHPRSPTEGVYYNAILQNLFFATLNQPQAARAFADDTPFQGKSATYGVNTLFRNNTPTPPRTPPRRTPRGSRRRIRP